MAQSDWVVMDYVARAKSRPTTYLKETTQPADLFAAFVEPLQALEEVFKLMYDGLSIYNASGVMLDSFGEMVSEPRLGRDDDVYRAAIIARRFTAGGSGTPDEVIVSTKGITSGDVRVLNHFPAAYIAIIHATNIPKTLPKQLNENSVSGVAAYPVFDYGRGGFELSGIAGAAQNAIGIHPGTDIAMGLLPGTDVVLGANAAYQALGGTRVASILEVTGNVDYGSARNGALYYGAFDAYRDK